MNAPTLRIAVLAPEPHMEGHRGQGNRIQHLLDVAYDLIATELPGCNFEVATTTSLALACARQRAWRTSIPEPEDVHRSIERANILVLIGSPADMRSPDYAFARSRPNMPTYQLYLLRRLP